MFVTICLHKLRTPAGPLYTHGASMYGWSGQMMCTICVTGLAKGIHKRISVGHKFIVVIRCNQEAIKRFNKASCGTVPVIWFLCRAQNNFTEYKVRVCGIPCVTQRVRGIQSKPYCMLLVSVTIYCFVSLFLSTWVGRGKYTHNAPSQPWRVKLIHKIDWFQKAFSSHRPFAAKHKSTFFHNCYKIRITALLRGL